MRQLVVSGLMVAGLALSVVATAHAQNYRRPADTAVAPPPVGQADHRANPAEPHAPRHNKYHGAGTWNGLEAPAYGYGYALNLPPDGNWRWISDRCYTGGQQQICVQGHWVRKRGSACEEVSAHQIRRGNYVRMVPAGPVTGCRR